MTMLRWSIFCAGTSRRMPTNLDWDRFREAQDGELAYDEQLARYSAIAEERLDAEAYEEFAQRHLGDLDAVVWEYFGTPRAREVIRAKVEVLFPEHEHDEFTQHFWEQVQSWRAEQEENR